MNMLINGIISNTMTIGHNIIPCGYIVHDDMLIKQALLSWIDVKLNIAYCVYFQLKKGGDVYIKCFLPEKKRNFLEFIK